MAIEHDLMAAYRDPVLDHKPELLSSRGGAYYSEAAVRLMASLHAGTGDIQVVDLRNAGAIPASRRTRWWRSLLGSSETDRTPSRSHPWRPSSSVSWSRRSRTNDSPWRLR